MFRYKPINGWTKQEIIDHLLRFPDVQSMTSLDGGSTYNCAYRGKYEGSACAVGRFLPDDILYDKLLSVPGMKAYRNSNTLWIYDLLTNFPGVMSFLPLPMTAMEKLQMIHDSFKESVGINKKLVSWVEENVVDS